MSYWHGQFASNSIKGDILSGPASSKTGYDSETTFFIRANHVSIGQVQECDGSGATLPPEARIA